MTIEKHKDNSTPLWRTPLLSVKHQDHIYPGGRSVEELAPPIKGGVGLFLCLINKRAKLYCDSSLRAAALW